MNTLTTPEWSAEGERAMQAHWSGATRRALLLLSALRNLARERHARDGEAVTLNRAAMVHLQRSDYWSAVACGLDAYHAGEAAGNRREMAAALIGIATALSIAAPAEDLLALLDVADLQLGDLDESSPEDRAATLALRAKLAVSRGILLAESGRLSESRQHFLDALELGHALPAQERCRLVMNYANFWTNQAHAANLAGDTAGAAQAVDLGTQQLAWAAALAREANTQAFGADLALVEACLHHYAGAAHRAQANFQRAWDEALSAQRLPLLPAIAAPLARQLMEAGNLNGAAVIAARALDAASLVQPSPKAEALCELAADIQAARGDLLGAAQLRVRGRTEAHAMHRMRAEVLAFVAALGPSPASCKACSATAVG